MNYCFPRDILLVRLRAFADTKLLLEISESKIYNFLLLPELSNGLREFKNQFNVTKHDSALSAVMLRSYKKEVL